MKAKRSLAPRRSLEPDLTLAVVGWREYVALPALGVHKIKAKIDTGARTSALHAFDLKISHDADGAAWATFMIHPRQDDRHEALEARMPVLEWRKVKSSNGKSERRPVIETQLLLGQQQWTIEITLTRRDAMGFRLLLGRQALRKHVLVDVSQSFVTRKAKEHK